MLKKCHYQQLGINLTKSWFMVLVVIVVASDLCIHKNAFCAGKLSGLITSESMKGFGGILNYSENPLWTVSFSLKRVTTARTCSL